MRVQLHPIFPEPIVEFNNIGVEQNKLQNLYEKQEWGDTNSDDNSDNFLKISKNLKALNEDEELKKIFADLINRYATEVMQYENKFYMTTFWFVKTEKIKFQYYMITEIQ